MPAEVQKRLRMLSVPQAWANWWEEVEGSRRQVSGARHWFNSNSSWGCQAATHSLLSLCCSVGWDSNCNRLCWQECEDLGLGFWGLSSLSLCPWWQVSQILQHLWAVRYLTSKVLWSSKDHFVWHTMGEVCSVSQVDEFDWAFFPSSVMYLQFVAKSHLFFTAGKDSKIKQWDADKFEHIQTLEVGSFRECWQEALCLHEQYFTQGLGAGWCSCLTSVHHAGTSPGGMVFGTESQWRLRSVSIPWQVPAPLGKDKGATYFGRGEGDGESCILHAKDNFQTCFLPSRQISHFSLRRSLAPCLVDLLVTTSTGWCWGAQGWLPSFAWLDCCC